MIFRGNLFVPYIQRILLVGERRGQRIIRAHAYMVHMGVQGQRYALFVFVVKILPLQEREECHIVNDI